MTRDMIAIDNAKVFQGFRRVFGCQSYIKVAHLAGWDSGQVSRMRSGKAPISDGFFLACCFAANLSPVEMCKRVGLPIEYFTKY